MDDEGIRRRVRAARILGGFESREDLATRLKELGYPKLGKDTLYNIESGRRAILRPDLNAIADACNLSPTFFTVDLKTFDVDGDRVTVLEERVSFLAEFLLENVVPTLGEEDEQARLAEQFQERGDAPARRTGRHGNQPPLTA